MRLGIRTRPSECRTSRRAARMDLRAIGVSSLIVLLCVQLVLAGITVTGENGISATGADGITYIGTSGIAATGADGLLAFGVNGITGTGADGIAATGADGATYTGTNGITATQVASLSIARADGISATGADGIIITGADGTTYHADSVLIRQASGIAATGADGIVATGADGIAATGADSRTIASADGITATGADSVTISRADGITATGADGSTYSISPNGVTITGADGIAATGADGISFTGASGIAATGADGIAATGADSQTLAHADGIAATGADGLGISRADGIAATGADGMTVTGGNGTQYRAVSVFIQRPTGITATGADGITATGADGITATGADSAQLVHANGIVATGADGIAATGADGIVATGADGLAFSISPNGVTITGANGIVATGADGVSITGASSITATGVQAVRSVGLQSLDPELAIALDRLTDDSNVAAAIVYYHVPSENDLADLLRLGIAGGTRYRALPVVLVTATKQQLIAVSRLPSVRSIYGNRTLQTSGVVGASQTRADRVRVDADLTKRNLGLPVSGRGVTVAVLDTGLDGTHADLSGRVIQNVKLASTQSASAGFTYPVSVENVPNTDQLYGHGTFVAGVIAGSGARSGGKFTGVAPGARLLGLSAGDLNLFFVLEGFDYLLTNGPALGVRVVNCSFSAETVYDANDPVNIATKLLTEHGINIVFSAGNSGPGPHTLNPYAMAPWVISVGATDDGGRLASFSSRGDFGSPLSHPTIVAPGVSVISLRSATSPSVEGALGVESGADAQRLTAAELPYYTTSSGTSFSAPQVAGAIALMLEANPFLTPSQVRDILQRSATPLPPYYAFEAGAGMLNTYAAVLEAAFPQRRMGTFRATLDRGQVRFINDPLQIFTGTVQPGGTSLNSVSIPQNALQASVQIAWGPMWSPNDLGLLLNNPDGVRAAESNAINLPGLTGKRESVSISMPAAGTWTAQVTNTFGFAGTTQAYTGVLAMTRAEYAPLLDIDTVSADVRQDIYENLNSFVMSPIGRKFRPQFSVSRFDLAAALMLGGRVSQFLPGQLNYPDVRGRSSMLIVESVQASPGGPLFPDASPGSRFRPDDRASRLSAAIALVRAAGLRSQAEAQAGIALPYADTYSIPPEWRGYVAVAVARGLLSADGGAFRPSDPLTRAELAHAMAVFARS